MTAHHRSPVMRHTARVPSDAWDISSQEFRKLLLDNAASAAHEARRPEVPCRHQLSLRRDKDDVEITALCADEVDLPVHKVPVRHFH